MVAPSRSLATTAIRVLTASAIVALGVVGAEWAELGEIANVEFAVAGDDDAAVAFAAACIA